MTVVLEAVAWIKQGAHIIDPIIVPLIRKIWRHYTLNKHGFHPIMSCCMSGEINCAKRTKIKLIFWSLGKILFGGGSLQTVRSSIHVQLKLLNVTKITESSDTPQSCSRTWNVEPRRVTVSGHTSVEHERTKVRRSCRVTRRGDEGAQRTQQNGLKSESRTPDLWAHR